MEYRCTNHYGDDDSMPSGSGRFVGVDEHNTPATLLAMRLSMLPTHSRSADACFAIGWTRVQLECMSLVAAIEATRMFDAQR